MAEGLTRYLLPVRGFWYLGILTSEGLDLKAGLAASLVPWIASIARAVAMALRAEQWVG